MRVNECSRIRDTDGRKAGTVGNKMAWPKGGARKRKAAGVIAVRRNVLMGWSVDVEHRSGDNGNRKY